MLPNSVSITAYGYDIEVVTEQVMANLRQEFPMLPLKKTLIISSNHISMTQPNGDTLMLKVEILRNIGFAGIRIKIMSTGVENLEDQKIQTLLKILGRNLNTVNPNAKKYSLSELL